MAVHSLSTIVTLDAPWQSRLRVQDVVSGCRHILVLSGELDIASADQLEAIVRRVCGKATCEVVLDLTKLTFVDSTGLQAIIAAGELCEEHGREFMLVPGPKNVQRVFEVTHLTERLPFRSRASAL